MRADQAALRISRRSIMYFQYSLSNFVRYTPLGKECLPKRTTQSTEHYPHYTSERTLSTNKSRNAVRPFTKTKPKRHFFRGFSILDVFGPRFFMIRKPSAYDWRFCGPERAKSELVQEISPHICTLGSSGSIMRRDTGH
ncbi:hypothetical protein BJX64DRAFT_11764 [Aspergillus heterothallicus]